ncbi:MAG TPA: class I SAM-dependent methyltransferase [Actinomycetota bacterium]|nr:class I SAM-dependent methyltransferase [Actinomycetota bacterium]
MTEPSREPERCCFDDWAGYSYERARKRGAAARVTAGLLEALGQAGLEGRSVLDVGCGVGDLATETIRLGAEWATGLDVSSENIALARRLAAERGVADRTRFEVGNGVIADLPAADVVVLNRVVCCYPDADGLVDRSLAATGSVYALTAPVSSGPVGVLNRVQTAVWNVVYAIRKRRYGGFRTFVHDMARLDERIRAAGFRPVRRERRRLVWDLAVYAR